GVLIGQAAQQLLEQARSQRVGARAVARRVVSAAQRLQERECLSAVAAQRDEAEETLARSGRCRADLVGERGPCFERQARGLLQLLLAAPFVRIDESELARGAIPARDLYRGSVANRDLQLAGRHRAVHRPPQNVV